MIDLIGKIQRGIKKPPKVILSRVMSELRAESERLHAPILRQFKPHKLLRELGSPSFDVLWHSLAERPYPAFIDRVKVGTYENCCPGDSERIIKKAEDALSHCVNFLGSGTVELGDTIDWHMDFKSGFTWPNRYFRDIDYNNPDRPSDVKIPWELSRQQWLIPAGQAYLLTDDEKYANAVRRILTSWIDCNPYAGTVNWACTMEVALRILTFTWLFHVFNETRAWRDVGFREKFLINLFLHVEFTERHLERSDINGNHYTADAAGLVFGGLFFGQGKKADRWQRLGWRILSEEIEHQVHADGVDFEASIPYHRLVAELFLLPALYRVEMDMPVEATYRKRLEAMAGFTAFYTKPNGSSPLWGDADDARAMPFGGQDINDHRYLIGLVGLAFKNMELMNYFSGPRDEIFWILGKDAVESLPTVTDPPRSKGFFDGGFYVMRYRDDHVFIDCGPVGLAGRGGHGHNDCLAFEAVLNGEPLISDCGAYLYTGSYVERNAFRSTAYHNTPQIDGEEINRFIHPEYLWNLEYDAVPKVHDWQVKEDYALFEGEHHGYRRLPSSVVPKRTIILDFDKHALFIGDYFRGDGMHDVVIPLHLSSDVGVSEINRNDLMLGAGDKFFKVWWPVNSGYTLSTEKGRVSPSYGVIKDLIKLTWTRKSASLKPMTIFIAPAGKEKEFELRVSSITAKRKSN